MQSTRDKACLIATSPSWHSKLDLLQSTEIQTKDIALQQVKLNNYERRIACLAYKGLSAKEISLQLIATEKTVRNKLSTFTSVPLTYTYNTGN
jgi:DNA-binding NarL/FixJ family response regulator